MLEPYFIPPSIHPSHQIINDHDGNNTNFIKRILKKGIDEISQRTVMVLLRNIHRNEEL